MICRPFFFPGFLAGALCCGGSGVAGGDQPLVPGNVLERYRVRAWTSEHGLPQSGVSCLEQTGDGYLWIGTRFGLARFDGIEFSVFKEENTPELAGRTITALVTDAAGTLWIGTQVDGAPGGSLVACRQGRFRRIAEREGLAPGPIKRLAKCRSGGVWAQVDDRLARVRDDKAVRVVESAFFDNDQIVLLSEAHDGWLEVLTEKCWLRLSPDGHQLVQKPLNPPMPFEWRTASEPTGSRCWIGTACGVFEVEGETCRPAGMPGPANAEVNAVYEGRDGAVWVNERDRELWVWSGSRWSSVDCGEGFERGSVTAILEDREQSLWLGTREGLFQRRRLPVATLSTGEGLPHQNVWSVCEASDGAVWVGTDGGVARVTDQAVEHWSAAEPLPGIWDRCIWPTPRGGVFIAKRERGILEASRDGRFYERIPLDRLAGKVTALWGERDGTLAVGTPAGIAVFGNAPPPARLQQVRAYNVPAACVIFRDRRGTLWAGTERHGLARLDGDAPRYFTVNEGLPDSTVFAIHEDEDGVLWLGTDHGLCRFADGRFFGYRQPHGFLEDTINWVLEDDLGFIWFSSLAGLHRASRTEMNAVAAGRAPRARVVSLGSADGMRNPETNGESQPAGCKDASGRLWFPTVQGVAVVNPRHLTAMGTEPRVSIQSVRTNGIPVAGQNLAAAGAPLRLRPGSGGLVEFFYTAPTFLEPGGVRFRHRLGGPGAEWSEPTSDRVARYVRVRPGSYRFEVSAISHQGVPSAAPDVIAFVLKPFFWQTWPFYGACVAALVGAVAILQGYRLKWKHRLSRLEGQRAFEAERARIARDLHDDLGTALTGLALEIDVVRHGAGNPPETTSRLRQTAQSARDLADRMREVVWMVNPRCDNVVSLAAFLEQQVARFLSARGIRIRLDFPDDIPAVGVTTEPRHQLALCVREALANVVRHSRATETSVKLELDGPWLVVRVRDNGCGFEPRTQAGHGLSNLRERMQQVGGQFECVSAPGQGATVTFRVPLPSRNGGEP